MLRGLQLRDSRQFSSSTFTATGFVKALPNAIRERLLRHGKSRKFAKGELIQQHGDAGEGFWHIVSGAVQIGRYSVGGELTLFAVLGPGESFGELAFLGEFPRLVDAIAGNETTLIQIGEAELEAAIASDGRVARILLKGMAHMVQQAFDLIEAGRNLSTVARLAQALVGLCDQGEGEFVVHITQQELADLVGVSRVSLGKALKILEMEKALMCRYGKIFVLDQAALLHKRDG